MSSPTKPKVAFLRGSFLNPFEGQYLEPLQDDYDIFAVQGGYQRYEVDTISVPRVEVTCLDYLNGLIPRTFAGFRVPNPLKFLGWEEVMLGLKRVLAGCDLVHVPEQSFVFSWQAARLRRELGYRLVTTQDEVTPYWYRDNAAISRRAATVREQTDLFLARSQRARAALRCEGIEPERIRVVGHGVDTTRFAPGDPNPELCASLDLDPDRFIILFVGRLVWTKGIFTLADAAKLLLQDPEIQDRDPLFLMVGEGPERDSLEGRLEALGVGDSFQFTGWRPYGELPDLHRLADIFVLPSISTRFINEQFGIALVESLATGKPIVSTYCGAIDEVVGDAGVLVQPNDHLRLAEALRTLIVHPERREDLGARARRRAERYFTRTAVAEQLDRAYSDVLSSS